MVCGMEEYYAHTAKHRFLYLNCYFIGNVAVLQMTPPDHNVRIFKELVGDAAVFVIKRSRSYGYIFIFTEEIRYCTVNALRINLCNFLLALFVPVLVPYSYSYHAKKPRMCN